MKNRRDHLLNTAERLLREGSMALICMEKVASVAGSSKATLYRHFGARDRLFAEVIRRDAENWREWFFDAVRDHSDGSAAGDLYAFVKVLRLWAEEPGFTGMLAARAVMELRPVPPAAQGEFERLYADIHGFFCESLRHMGCPHPEIPSRWICASVLSIMAYCPWVAGQTVPERWALLRAQIDFAPNFASECKTGRKSSKPSCRK